MNLGTIIQMAGTPAVGCSVLLGVSFVVIILISWACRNNRSEQSLDVSSPASALLKLIKVHLNPRISRLAIGYRLKKVCAAGKRWQCFGIMLWRCLGEKSLTDFRLWIAARQEKRVMRLWRNRNCLPREQDKGVTVKGAAVMNPNLSDGKRQIFRLVDERHAKNMTTMIWVGDASGLDTEWESLLYDRQKTRNKLPNPTQCCKNGGHENVRVALTPNNESAAILRSNIVVFFSFSF